MLASITPSPIWQSCARCTYDIMKLLGPTLVLNDCDVPRLIVLYSRITVLSPIYSCTLALELQILRIAAQYASDPDLYIPPKSDVAFERNASADDTAITQRAVVADDCEWPHLHISAEVGRR